MGLLLLPLTALSPRKEKFHEKRIGLLIAALLLMVFDVSNWGNYSPQTDSSSRELLCIVHIQIVRIDEI